MNHTEERIVQLLKAQPLTAQEVAAKTNLNVNYIHGTLKNMETKGRIASSAMSGSRKYNVRPTTADEMSLRREVYAKFGTIPILI